MWNTATSLHQKTHLNLFQNLKCKLNVFFPPNFIQINVYCHSQFWTTVLSYNKIKKKRKKENQLLQYSHVSTRTSTIPYIINLKSIQINNNLIKDHIPHGGANKEINTKI